MLKWFNRLRRSRPPFEERFRALVEAYGLAGQADIHEYFGYGHSSFTLFRIIGEGEPDRPLPQTFVTAVQALVREYWPWRTLTVSPAGRTLRQIQTHQAIFALDAKVCGD